jgi:phospholipid/cholesterol/gamma-HCH transport system substrate-binding protein
MFLAVEPGSADRPALADNSTVQGISPPRLDLLLSESYELLHKAYMGVANNEQKLSETFDGLHKTLRASGSFFEHNSEKLDRIVDNMDKVSAEASDAVKAARERYIDGPQVSRIFNDVERSSKVLAENLPPIVEDGRKVLSDTKKITGKLSTEEQLARLDNMARDLADASGRAKALTQDAEGLMKHVKSGKGTVGALVMDEALYDDLQEMIRDLKHNPWKFFWKE